MAPPWRFPWPVWHALGMCEPDPVRWRQTRQRVERTQCALLIQCTIRADIASRTCPVCLCALDAATPLLIDPATALGLLDVAVRLRRPHDRQRVTYITSSCVFSRKPHPGFAAIGGSTASLQASVSGSCGRFRHRNDLPNASPFLGRYRSRVHGVTRRHCTKAAERGPRIITASWII